MAAASSAPKARESEYEMISMDDALQKVLASCDAEEAAKPVLTPLLASCGRVVAEDVRTTIPLPPFRASVMDGYAMATGDVAGVYPVKGRVHAGDYPNFSIGPGEVAYVTAGAPVPAGTAFVTKVELSEAVDAPEPRSKHSVISAEESEVRILSVTDAANIRPVGCDLAEGDIVVPRGTLLTPAEVGLLATAGVAAVPVMPKVKVGVFSTGDELVDPQPDRKPEPGQVFDANRYTILSLVEAAGAAGVDLGIVPDAAPDKAAVLASFLDQCSLLVSTGGVSMGETDWIKPALQDAGFAIAFGRLCMKPGKPTTFAVQTASQPVQRFFGLPGNPASALVTAQLLLLPTLRRLQGLTPSACVPAELQLPLHAQGPKTFVPLDSERPEYHRVVIAPDAQGSLQAHSTGNQRSSMLRSCRGANGLALLPRGSGAVSNGQSVRVLVTGAVGGSAGEGSANGASAPDGGAAPADHDADCECCRPALAGSATADVTGRPTAPPAEPPMEVRVGLLVASDRASEGVYEDRSAPAMAAALHEVSSQYKIVTQLVIPDEADAIQAAIRDMADGGGVDVLLTSGGTGFGPRDVTPEAVKGVLEREAPGIAMALLLKGLEHTPFAVMSRPVVGTRKRCFIATLPGSPKAIRENIHALLPLLPKVVLLLRKGECDHDT